MTDPTHDDDEPRAVTDALDLVHDQWLPGQTSTSRPSLLWGASPGSRASSSAAATSCWVTTASAAPTSTCSPRWCAPTCPTSPGRLAEQTLLSPPAVTKRLKGLTAAGLVERSDNPADARGYFVSPTTRGRELLHEVLDVQLEAEAAMTTSLDPVAVAAVTAGLRSMLLDLEAGAEQDGEGPAPPRGGTGPGSRLSDSNRRPSLYKSTALPDCAKAAGRDHPTDPTSAGAGGEAAASTPGARLPACTSRRIRR